MSEENALVWLVLSWVWGMFLNQKILPQQHRYCQWTLQIQDVRSPPCRVSSQDRAPRQVQFEGVCNKVPSAFKEE